MTRINFLTSFVLCILIFAWIGPAVSIKCWRCFGEEDDWNCETSAKVVNCDDIWPNPKSAHLRPNACFAQVKRRKVTDMGCFVRIEEPEKDKPIMQCMPSGMCRCYTDLCVDTKGSTDGNGGGGGVGGNGSPNQESGNGPAGPSFAPSGPTEFGSDGNGESNAPGEPGERSSG